MKPHSVIYTRVSTTKQGANGLGMEAQLETCRQAAALGGSEVVAEFSDVESGKSRTRSGLWSAIEYCKKNDYTLVIAKLDRLARDVEFTFKIVNTGIDIYFCDMPSVNTMILGVFASVAQYERELLSSRTEAAIDSIKAHIAQNGYHTSKRSGAPIQRLGNPFWEDSYMEASAAATRKRFEEYRNDPKRINAYIIARGLMNQGDDIHKVVATLNSLSSDTLPKQIKSWNYRNVKRLMERMDGVEGTYKVMEE